MELRTDLASKTEVDELQFTDIRSCWEDIKPGIVEILEQDKFPTIRPEEVYSECVNGRAFLYTSKDAFVILTLEEDEFLDEKRLVVWLAYAYKTGAYLWVSHKDWFNALAKELNCQYIVAKSNTKKLSDYFLRTGWSLETRVFKTEVK
jgi:hypothetical protein